MVKQKGRLITCRYCKNKFSIPEDLKQQWFELKNPCPSCKTLYCNLLPIEKKLQEIQSDYYANNKSDFYLGKLYELLVLYSKPICIKLIGKRLRNEQDIEYHAHKASIKLISQYLRNDRRDKKDFWITDSFSSFIGWKVRESFFEKEEHDCASESISDVSNEGEDDYNGDFRLGYYDFSVECPKLEQVKLDIQNEEKNKELLIYFDSLIENGELKLAVAILNYLKGGENKSNEVFQYFGNENKGRFIYIMNQFRKKLSEGHFQ